MHGSEVRLIFEVARTSLCSNLRPPSTVSTIADVGSFIESKTSVVQTSNVGFTSEVPDYLVVHTGHEEADRKRWEDNIKERTSLEWNNIIPRKAENR